jgi:hypothetical protein
MADRYENVNDAIFTETELAKRVQELEEANAKLVMAVNDAIVFLNHANIPGEYATPGYIAEYHMKMKKVKAQIIKVLPNP